LKFALGLEEPTEEQKLSANVVNPSDEEINVGDALVILRESLGLITPEEKETRVDTSIDILNQPEVSFREEYWGVSILNKYADDSDIGITQKGEMVQPLLNEYEATDNPAFGAVAGDSLVKIGASVFCDSYDDENLKKTSADIVTTISAAEPELGANIAIEVAAQPEFGLEGANSFFLTLRDNDWQAFSRTFGELCELDVSLAADSFNSDFGISNNLERIYTVGNLLPRGGMSPDQIIYLLSTKDENGYLIPDKKTIDFFFGWTRQMGGESPWDEAIVPFINSGRGEKLLGPLINEYKSIGRTVDEPMKNQIFLSLVDVTQKGDAPGSQAFLNSCVEQEIFELDPEVDLTESQTEDEWKKIALSSDSEWTRAAALSQIEDKNWFKTYVFDTDSKKGLVFDRDVSDTEFAAILRTGETSSWYGQLTDKEERKYYIRKVLVADTTDSKVYKYATFTCLSFAVQLHMNGLGFRDEFIGNIENWEYSGYTIPKNPYGISIHFVGVVSSSFGHALNAVFIGDNIDDPEQTKIWDNWLFIEPTNDRNPAPGNWDMPLNTTTKIYPSGGGFIIPYSYSNPSILATFHINNE